MEIIPFQTSWSSLASEFNTSPEDAEFLPSPLLVNLPTATQKCNYSYKLLIQCPQSHMKNQFCLHYPLANPWIWGSQLNNLIFKFFFSKPGSVLVQGAGQHNPATLQTTPPLKTESVFHGPCPFLQAANERKQ